MGASLLQEAQLATLLALFPAASPRPLLPGMGSAEGGSTLLVLQTLLEARHRVPPLTIRRHFPVLARLTAQGQPETRTAG